MLLHWLVVSVFCTYLTVWLILICPVFATFQGAFTGVCSAQHVPSYKKNLDKFKAKGVDSVICVAVNDPYVMNGWAKKLECKDGIEFYGDFDGKFHKSLDMSVDLTSALLGTRSKRYVKGFPSCL